ncbi:hypothetical protein A4R44_06263 [Amycolatopsis sp. M39]|nr:hypothetical protein A4R44_06263 [Amycolatopsis sp. M39]
MQHRVSRPPEELAAVANIASSRPWRRARCSQEAGPLSAKPRLSACAGSVQASAPWPRSRDEQSGTSPRCSCRAGSRCPGPPRRCVSWPLSSLPTRQNSRALSSEVSPTSNTADRIPRNSRQNLPRSTSQASAPATRTRSGVNGGQPPFPPATGEGRAARQSGLLVSGPLPPRPGTVAEDDQSTQERSISCQDTDQASGAQRISRARRPDRCPALTGKRDCSQSSAPRSRPAC